MGRLVQPSGLVIVAVMLSLGCNDYAVIEVRNSSPHTIYVRYANGIESFKSGEINSGSGRIYDDSPSKLPKRIVLTWWIVGRDNDLPALTNSEIDIPKADSAKTEQRLIIELSGKKTWTARFE